MRSVILGMILMLSAASYLAAQTPTPLPENTINCASFQKLPNGSWFAATRTTFDIGNARAITLANQAVGPRFFNIGGADLYEVLERKCGGSRN